MKLIFDSYPGCLLLLIGLVAKNSVAISQTEQTIIRTKLFPVKLECMQSNPLTFAQMKSLKNNIVPDEQNAKCFVACLYKKMGIMDDMGMFSPASARKQAETVFKDDEEKLQNVDRIMQHCSYVNEQYNDDSAGCDRAKELFSCFVKNGPKYGF